MALFLLTEHIFTVYYFLMPEKKRCVIVSAAEIKNYSKIKSYLSKNDFFIYCDGGLNHQEKLGFKPDLIIGDFDSFKKPDTSIEIIALPCEKDDTDTFFAVKEALNRGFNDFVFIGSIGNRFDHSLCNISALMYLYQKKIPALLLDDYSEITIADKNPSKVKDEFAYFSLMNIAGNVKGVTITNAKYPLKNAAIKASYQFGISNQVIPGKEAVITIKKGILLLVKIWK